MGIRFLRVHFTRMLLIEVDMSCWNYLDSVSFMWKHPKAWLRLAYFVVDTHRMPMGSITAQVELSFGIIMSRTVNIGPTSFVLGYIKLVGPNQWRLKKVSTATRFVITTAQSTDPTSFRKAQSAAQPCKGVSVSTTIWGIEIRHNSHWLRL